MAVKMLKLRSRKEWLEHRNKYIGGSEASCIVGLNPYMTNLELWEIKTGRREPKDLSDNPSVEYGRNAEEYLRELFKLDFPQYEVNYIENNSVLNTKYPYAAASLDGWLTDDLGRLGILEIKTSTIQKGYQRTLWNKRIPDNYFIQVLHYMMVTEAEFAILKAQLKYDYSGKIFLNTKHYRIERSEVEDDIEYLMEAEKKFSEHIRNDTKPNLVLPMI